MKSFLLLLLIVTTTTAEAQVLERKIKSDTIYTIIEQMPEYPGGMAAMYKFINGTIIYPRTAIDNAIEGKVIVQFIVCSDGSVCNARAIGVPDSSLRQEAIRVLSLMPKWNAGMQNGKKVSTQYSLPINFKFADNENIDKTNKK